MKTDEKQNPAKTLDDAIMINAITTTLSTDGVFELYGGVNRDNYLKFKKTGLKKGIKVSREESKVFIDLYVILKYGVKIPEVAWAIQKNIKKELDKIEPLEIKGINIHIKGINSEEAMYE